MRRCISVLTLCAVLLFTLLAVPAFAEQQIQVTVDGRTLSFDVPPTIIDGRTLVPTRFIAESLGARVEWQAQTRTVSITSSGSAPPVPGQPPVTGTEPLKVVLLGGLASGNFIESASQGMQLIKSRFGAAVSTIDISDPGQLRPTLQRVSGEDWDIIIAGAWVMKEHVEQVAPLHPDKRYILFAAEVDYARGGLDNVYSILFQENEGAFLAGALAALVTDSDMPHATSEKIVGFIGGMDIEVIRNFLIGYLEGALYVDPSVKVMVDFTGSFTDEAAGRERADAQYSWGTDIIFAAAGEAGLGQVEAAKEWERYAIGVDYDQSMSFAQSDTVKANLILTSVIMRIDNTLLQSVEKHLAGTLPYGQAEAWGVAHEAIGLADNTFYQRNVPSAIRSEMNRITTLIANGTIRVGNTYTVSETELWQLVENVAP